VRRRSGASTSPPRRQTGSPGSRRSSAAST
jgi:hypothetical protein